MNIVRHLKIVLLVVFLSLLLLDCQEIGRLTKKDDYSNYLEYFIVKKNGNELQNIHLIKDIYKHNYRDFLRLGYSAVDGLFVEYREGEKQYLWYAFINYLQAVGVQSLFDQFEVPLSEQDAIHAGYKIVQKEKDCVCYSYKTGDKEIEVSFSLNGSIHLNKVNKRLSENIWVEYLGNANGAPIDSNILKKMLHFKEIADEGESFLQEAIRKNANYSGRFASEIKMSIEKIQSIFPEYYYGLVDYGNFSYNIERNKNKAEYYLKKAIDLNRKKGAAYAFLLSLYILNGESPNATKLRDAMGHLLDKNEHFIADQNLISILIRSGKIDEAENLLHSVIKEYIEPQYKDAIKQLKENIDKKRILINLSNN